MCRKYWLTCLYAGQQLAMERRIVLPLLPESLYLLGGVVMAAGKAVEKESSHSQPPVRRGGKAA
jgi:hypothetical protein